MVDLGLDVGRLVNVSCEGECWLEDGCAGVANEVVGHFFAMFHASEKMISPFVVWPSAWA